LFKIINYYFQNFKSISIDDWDENFQIYYCLFCDNSFENEELILEHLKVCLPIILLLTLNQILHILFKNNHNFDLRATIQTHNLSFYTQVKLINYIRREVSIFDTTSNTLIFIEIFLLDVY
jgi:hypothetical protein